MKKIALLLGLLLATPAFAADNAVIVTPGVGVTMKSKDIGAGVQAMQPILSDASGNALLTTLGADAVSNTLTGIPVYSRQLFYNGTTWDRWQGAVTATLAAETTKVIGTVRIASGGVASGSFASGAFASGSIASGAIAAGAQVDLLTMRGTLNAGTAAANSLAVGGVYNSSPLTMTTTQQASLQLDANGYLKTLVTNAATPGGAAPAASSPVVNANQYSNYETVAASQTAQAMGATGATGDYLSHCVIYPTSTSPGVVTVFDNTNAAGTNVIAFAGGATSTSNLTPIAVPVGSFSTAGAWKVTTGASVSVTCYGKFT